MFFRKIIFGLLLITSTSLFAQVETKKELDVEESDTTTIDSILLKEVIIYRNKLSAEERKQFLLLQNRVYKVYPYAKIASERLVSLNNTMSKLKSNKEKKRYSKIVEDYMENEFKAQLKKLSRKQGQILVKLIYRQTGVSTYDLIKEHKSGWKAFWSNNTARLFDINLKTGYDPYQVNEDYLIETILYRAFYNGRLAEQKSANPVDIDDLNVHWMNKSNELVKNKKE
ncbi:DUF4294 domain-containing protein [Flavobacterium sp.]|uniref:DUF4294 domain-containing protein n=1 Tax=Flavobacterium sp. TaxID=239 RepID=UPI002B4AF0E7|nr:DUF4294 domain-containing protein [Flavobacterium sp.]HLP63603.1 DUF4294 domain-containing protein [Flavobacterium sp.]